MKIDTSTIEGYAEMSPEQKVAALEAIEYDDTTALKRALDKATKEAADNKRKLSERQTEEERKQAEIAEETAQMRAELEQYKTAEREAGYAVKLIGIGLDENSAKAIAKGLPAGINDDFWQGLKKSRDDLETTIKSANVRGMPRPATGGVATDTRKKIADYLSEKNEAAAIHVFRTMNEQ